MTISKRKKERYRILDALKDKAELSTDRGKVEQSQFTKPNKKVRRHSGRYTPRISGKIKFSEMIANAEEPKEEYDDWDNYRDSFRDKTKIRNEYLFDYEEDINLVRSRNKKIKKQLAIKKAQKDKNIVKGAALN